MSTIINSYPLTPIQQGMLLLWASDRRAGFDIEQIICTYRMPLDVTAFKIAWETVVSRHPVLRTSFRWEKLPEPLQDVHSAVELPFTEIDWSKISPDEHDK